jgi:uncharacterized Zn finger protein
MPSKLPSLAVYAKGKHYADTGAVEEIEEVRVFVVAGRHKVQYHGGDGTYTCDCQAGGHDITCSHVIAVELVINAE